jgi:methylmalonyl-CoA mutase N-terminal domain/subunit
MQREIHEAAYRYQREVESGRRTVVGVNAFSTEEAPPKGLLRVNPAVEQAQRGRVEALKAGRDNQAVAKALLELRAAADGSANLMPAIIAAVKLDATLGEVCGVLRESFGEYRASSLL